MERVVAASCEPPREQISGIIDGQVVPITSVPLLTSATRPWSGFLLETYSAQVVRSDVRWGWHRTHVCLLTRGTIRFRVHWNQEEQDFMGEAGSAYVFPSGFDETHFSYAQSDFELICVEIDPARLSKLLGKRGPIALEPQMCIHDVHISALLKSMAAEVADGCPTGALYGESLSLSLAAYLEGRFSADKTGRRRLDRQFRDGQARQLVEYIRTNLSYDLNLGNLADLVDMSPRQFYRLFSSTFGSTPHRYITNERVARAKELLAAGLSLVEIAHALGFASQSHFTNVFSKTTGMSPGRFRQENGPHWVYKKPLNLDDGLAAPSVLRPEKNGSGSSRILLPPFSAKQPGPDKRLRLVGRAKSKERQG